MHSLTITLGVMAALLHGIAYILYNVQTKLGQSQPNSASWSIWAFLATLNALSFREMSGDTIAALQFITGSVACILTFVYALVIGKMTWPKRKDWIAFGLGLAATGVWWKFRSATGANMVVLLAFLISFVPTFSGVLTDPNKETPRSWVLWTIALLVTTLNVSLQKGWHMALVTPTVLLVAHGSIAYLASNTRKERCRSLRTSTQRLGGVS